MIIPAWSRAGLTQFFGARLFGVVLWAALAIATPAPAMAQQNTVDKGAAIMQGSGASGLALPRFVSLRAAKVNMRTGPGIRYPIDWVLTRRGLPLEVIGEFEAWRRIRDWQGSTGWVHQSMLAGQRGAMVLGKQRLMRRNPEDEAPGVALVEAGVVGRLLNCGLGWCRIEIKGFEGWIKQDEIYGVYPDERVK